MRQSDICVVMNAGSGKGEDAERVRAAFQALDVPVTLQLVTDGSRITAAARKALNDGYPTIVAAGGDGTICAVAAALRESDRTMGILPLGTFNYFARSLDLPQELEAAVQVICKGRTAPIRVATINDRVFLNNASLGIYPAILETREDIYGRWGRSRTAAYWSVLKTLARMGKPMRLRITVDGVERMVRTPLVFVVNNAFQLEQIGLDGVDRIAAGELVVFIAHDSGRLGMVRHALALAVGNAEKDRNFELMSGKEVRIEIITRRRKPHQVARDGERERIGAPYDLKVVPQGLTAPVPEGWDATVR